MVTTAAQDPWHFPRNTLATSVLETLDSGIVSAVTLFAPRRMGKTQFVCSDLGPLAVGKGWRVAYCNLWDDKSNPAEAVIAAVAAAADPAARKKTGKVGIAANLGIITASAEASEEIPARNAPSRIGEAFNAYDRCKGPRLLLMVDEIQHLAIDRKFEPAVASLRTSLERHYRRVKTVFTGSSQHGLQKMFLDTRAPFFSPGGQMELPQLEADFVEFMVERANKTFRAKVALAEATEMFEASGRSPYFLRQAITVARLRELTLPQALDVVIEETLNEEALARRWARLTATERAVALLVMQGKAPFAAASLEELTRAARKDVRSSHVQTVLQRLERDGFVERGMRGGYAVADPMVQVWMRRVRRPS